MSFCKICLSVKTRIYCTIKSHVILRCQECGFGFVEIDQNITNEFYEEDYFSGEKASFAQEKDAQISEEQQFIVDNYVFKNYQNPHSLISCLEIGPGIAGKVFKYLNSTNKHIQYSAIELSRIATDFLKGMGADVYCGKIYDDLTKNLISRGNKQNKDFDVIFGFEVIEHDTNPYLFMSAVHSMLTSGGYCVFSTGNLDGLMAKFHKNNWYYLDPPAHVSYFTPKSLKILLEKIGFSKVYIRRFGFNYVRMYQRYKIPFFLDIVDYLNISTGMIVIAEK